MVKTTYNTDESDDAINQRERVANEPKVSLFEQIVETEFSKYANDEADSGKKILKRCKDKDCVDGGLDYKVYRCGEYFSILNKKSLFSKILNKENLFSKARLVAKIPHPRSMCGDCLNYDFDISISVYSQDFLPYAISIGKQYKSKKIGSMEICVNWRV